MHLPRREASWLMSVLQPLPDEWSAQVPERERPQHEVELLGLAGGVDRQWESEEPSAPAVSRVEPSARWPMALPEARRRP